MPIPCDGGNGENSTMRGFRHKKAYLMDDLKDKKGSVAKVEFPQKISENKGNNLTFRTGKIYPCKQLKKLHSC